MDQPMIESQGTLRWDTLIDLLRYRGLKTPDRPAFRYLANGEEESLTLTYRELDERVRAVAAQLQIRELTGKRVLLLYPSGLDFVTAFFGCLYAGAVAVPAYPPKKNHHMKRLKNIADDADAAAILTTRALVERHMKSADEHGWRGMRWIASDEMTSSGRFPLGTTAIGKRNAGISSIYIRFNGIAERGDGHPRQPAAQYEHVSNRLRIG